VGDDTYRIREGAVLVEGRGAGGVDTVVVYGMNHMLGGDFENLSFKYTTNYTIEQWLNGQAWGAVGVGNAWANAITGAGAQDTLSGGDGDDTINGFDGDDSLMGGLGNDALYGSYGDDVLDGGDGDDMLNGEHNADLLRGGAGNDLLIGGAKPDTLEGGDGNDTLDAGGDSDLMSGGAGADVFVFDITISGMRDPDLYMGWPNRITDFERGLDRLDFSAVPDAFVANSIPNGPAQLALTTGPAAFALWQEVQDATTIILSGDIDGDGQVDFEMEVMFADGQPAGLIAATDFIL
jgi:Ca2+-binding RTX toxin-like protein